MFKACFGTFQKCCVATNRTNSAFNFVFYLGELEITQNIPQFWKLRVSGKIFEG